MTTLEGTIRQTPEAAGDDHPTRWHTLWACFFGYMLNAMDVLVLAPVVRELPGEFVINNADVVLITTVTLLTSAFGGWLAGWMSDRFGRVYTIQVMIVLFAGSTVLCGFASNVLWLFGLRALMGIGFGGQWAAAAVMVGEAFGKAHRGKAVGFMQSGWAIGWAAAYFVWPPLLHLILPSDVVWKGLFWLGGLLPFVLIFYVYLFVKESPGFLKVAATKEAEPLDIFSPRMLWTTFWSCLLSIGTMGGYYAILLWLPKFLDELKLDVLGKFYLAILIAGSGVGYLASAFLSDLGRFGWRGNFGLFAICTIVLCQPMFMVETGTGWYPVILVTGAGVGYLLSALVSALVGGLLRDRDRGRLFGRRRNFVLFAIFAIASVFACICYADEKIIEVSDRQRIILWLAFPLGFFASGAFAGSGAFFTELFPDARMRGMGVGFTYNFGRGFAVLILWLIPWFTGDRLPPGLWTSLLQRLSTTLPPELSTTLSTLQMIPPLGLSIGLLVLIAYGLVVVAALLLRETAGTVLDTDVGETP